MVQLRYPQVSVVRVCSRERQRNTSPNHTDRPCDGCDTWDSWCGRHSCCWRLEQADIRAERARPARPEWTADTTIEALREWRRRHGKPPKAADWATTTDSHPSVTIVFRLFGTWNNAVRAAGLTPNRNGRRDW